jgi:hypothetical protein
MNHPDKKQLVDILIGSANDKASATAIAHLKECRECANTMESLKIIIHASDKSSIFTPEHIKNSLFLSHGNANKASYGKTGELISALKIFLRPTAIAVTAVAVVVITVFTLYINKDQSSVNIALKLSLHHGSLVYNDEIFEKTTAEVNPGQIKTGNNSSALLAVEPAISIKIAENTNISVSSAQEIPEKDKKKYIASLDMKSGIIMVSSNHNLIKKYTITTPHAVFEPIGTGFILSADNTSSRLSVLEGMVRVSIQGNKEIILNKGEGCEINSGFVKINIDSEKITDAFNRIFYNTKDINTFVSEKRSEQETPENKNSGYGKEVNGTAGENQADTQKQENAGKEVRENKNDIRNEAKQIQKEMRNNRKSGRGSQR